MGYFDPGFYRAEMGPNEMEARVEGRLQRLAEIVKDSKWKKVKRSEFIDYEATQSGSSDESDEMIESDVEDRSGSISPEGEEDDELDSSQSDLKHSRIRYCQSPLSSVASLNMSSTSDGNDDDDQIRTSMHKDFSQPQLQSENPFGPSLVRKGKFPTSQEFMDGKDAEELQLYSTQFSNSSDANDENIYFGDEESDEEADRVSQQNKKDMRQADVLKSPSKVEQLNVFL